MMNILSFQKKYRSMMENDLFESLQDQSHVKTMTSRILSSKQGPVKAKKLSAQPLMRSTKTLTFASSFSCLDFVLVSSSCLLCFRAAAQLGLSQRQAVTVRSHPIINQISKVSHPPSSVVVPSADSCLPLPVDTTQYAQSLSGNTSGNPTCQF